jgi:rsbT antagonist protein RsbS
MSIPGLHLTQIGRGDFLLDPSKSLNIRNSGQLIEDTTARLLQARAVRLYYDLSEQPLIDPVYYAWLDALARALQAINVRMICIQMQPTAAFGLSSFLQQRPLFETARDIDGWRE